MEEVVADHITATSPIAPKVLGGTAGRITCVRRHSVGGTGLPDQGRVPLTSRTPVPRVHDRAGALRLMAAGRRLLSAVVLGLVAVGLPATAAGHDGITGVFVEPDLVNPGGVIVVRGDNVSTDDPVRVELITGVTRIELGTAAHRRRGPLHDRCHDPAGDDRRSLHDRGHRPVRRSHVRGSPRPRDSVLRRPERSAPGTR